MCCRTSFARALRHLDIRVAQDLRQLVKVATVHNSRCTKRRCIQRRKSLQRTRGVPDETAGILSSIYSCENCGGLLLRELRRKPLMTPGPHEVTRLLREWSQGDQAALDQLIPLVYDELHRLAHQHMRREKPGHYLQTSALINEAYIRLVEQPQIHWENRSHFFGIAARLMRRILVDEARKRNSAKRGGRAIQVSMVDATNVSQEQATNIVALDDALKSLEAVDSRQSEIVELRFFGGLSIEETAEVLKVSPGTVMRDWTFARAWLRNQMTV
jgi:RNA polymerase sigma factor (TIGR02999 family)